MLSRKRRLPKAFFEKNFLSRGSFFDSAFFSFKYGNLPAGETRFGCVISKKVAQSAARRNQLRRFFYRTLSEFYPGVRPGFYGLFFLKKEALNVSQALLKQEIENALKKSGFLI